MPSKQEISANRFARQDLDPWSPLEMGAAGLFGIVAGINAIRFGLGIEFAAGVAAAAAVLIPRQLGPATAFLAWYLAPLAMVGLQAKISSGCMTCGPVPSASAPVGMAAVGAFLGLLMVAVLALLRVSSPGRLVLGAVLFVGQAGLLLAVPSLCLACVLCTTVVAGLLLVEEPPSFALGVTYRRVTAGVAALGVVTAVMVASGLFTRPSEGVTQSRLVPPRAALRASTFPKVGSW